MPSPICTVNGTDASLGFVSVAASSTPTIALQNIAGVKSWVVTCKSTDETTTAAAINGTISTNIVNKTATFDAPGPGGSALIFKSVVNGGVDAQGRTDPSLSTTFKVCVLTPLGYAVAAFDEQLEHDPANGYIPVLNEAIRNATNTAASAGDGLYYLGGAYNVGAGDASIIINPDSIQVGVLQSDASHGVRGGGTQHALATNVAAGFMSAADKTLLSGASASATPSTLMLRDIAGSTSVVDLRADRVLTQVAGAIIGSNSGVSSNSVIYTSGDTTSGASGPVSFKSGNLSASGGASSGSVTVRSGDVTGGGGPSGAASFGSGVSRGAFSSGNVTVSSGNSGGSNPSGSVTINTGTTTGTIVGSVSITIGTSTAALSSSHAPGITIRTPNSGVAANSNPVILVKGGDASGTGATYSGSVCITAGRQTVGTPSGYGIALGYYDATDSNYTPATISGLFGGGQNVMFWGAAQAAPTGSIPATGAAVWADAATSSIKVRFGNITKTVQLV